MIAELTPLHETRAGMELLEEGIAKGIAKGIEKGIEKGIAKGIEKGIENLVRQMIAKGLTPLEISGLTDLSIPDITRFLTVEGD